MDTRLITFGAGSFWAVEAVFQEVEGVVKVTSGYSGGTHEPYPSHYAMWPEMKNFAEVVQVEYNPEITSLADLLYIFMTIHDPTSKIQNGSTADSRYRSIIFYENNYEKAIIDLVMEDMQLGFSNPIITEVKRFERFFIAQENDQKFYQRHKKYGSYMQFIDQILIKFRRQHPVKLRANLSYTKQLESA
ncbi:peptide-methionine (S)-S-oxide reductase MsrA [uncultured Croceitalea sp.]|uniref:peptide-methionine (S)-S-oxide reductase MsrA n=1 Tax=uncultured Croceitalea sp. TaxID=1798908 RepID=UPI00374F03B1